jgi:catalase
MNGYGSHTFSLINAKNELFYVKWHFKTKQGIKNFTREEADHMKSVDMDHSQNDLFHAIEKGDFPKWKMQIQVMPEAEAQTYHINPFDLTKVWPHADYPVIEVGELELNRNPENYFAEVEQAAFDPKNVAPGMGFSPDKMLQGRLISYPDAHRYRIGVNYNLLPVNEPKCPYSTYNRDGSMRFNANGGASPNYEPNSFGGPTQEPKYVERPTTYGTSTVGRFSHREHDGDYYTQPGQLFRLMTPEQRKRLIGNIAGGLSQTPRHIQERQLEHFFKADPAYEEGVANALGVPVRELAAAK